MFTLLFPWWFFMSLNHINWDKFILDLIYQDLFQWSQRRQVQYREAEPLLMPTSICTQLSYNRNVINTTSTSFNCYDFYQKWKNKTKQNKNERIKEKQSLFILNTIPWFFLYSCLKDKIIVRLREVFINLATNRKHGFC